MKRASSLDYHSIGQSLKRVKISTSPGELRLDKDLESLVVTHRWVALDAVVVAAPAPPANNAIASEAYPWSIPLSSSSFAGRGSGRVRAYGEIRSPDGTAKVSRDPVDPLRLRLTCMHRPPSSSSSLLPLEVWNFFIQMPRMYPHKPPAIVRVSREAAAPGDLSIGTDAAMHSGGIGGGGFPGWNGYCERGRASAEIVASSVMQAHADPPVPERIVISARPPYLNFVAQHDAENVAEHSNGATSGTPLPLVFDAATCTYNDWSPVSTLGDLIDFLIRIPANRRESWASERQNRLRYEQDFRNPSCAGARQAPSPVVQPTIAPSTSHTIETWTSRKQHVVHSSACDMDDGEDIQAMAEDSMSGHTSVLGKHTSVDFSPNRFDVGYDRGTSGWHWGMR